MNPSEIYHFYSNNVTYDETDIIYWHYRTVEQTIEEGIGKCHDAGRFFYEKLMEAGYETTRFLMLIKDSEYVPHQFDDSNHTIVTFKRDDMYYWIEGTWWSVCGIHGPFIDIKSLLKNIDHLYKTIWKADPENPAPKGLYFKFYEFNEEALYDIEGTDLNIDEFITVVKGKRIEIYEHNIDFHDHKSDKTFILIDDRKRRESYAKALRNLCNEHKINNVVYTNEEWELIKESIQNPYILKISKPEPIKEQEDAGDLVDMFTLKIRNDDMVMTLIYPDHEEEIRSIQGNMRNPEIINNNLIHPITLNEYKIDASKSSDYLYLAWFPDVDRAIYRHKPVAKLLLQRFGLI